MLTLIRCPFHHRVIAVARKDPDPSAKSVSGRLYRNTHTFLTPRSQSGLTMLSRYNVGAYQGTSSHATRSGTLSHSRGSSRIHCELILAQRLVLVCACSSALKRIVENKQTTTKAQAGIADSLKLFPPNPRMRGKAPINHSYLKVSEKFAAACSFVLGRCRLKAFLLV